MKTESRSPAELMVVAAAVAFICIALFGCAAPAPIAKEAATISVPAPSPNLLLLCDAPSKPAAADENAMIEALGATVATAKKCRQLQGQWIDYFHATIEPLTK